MSIDDAIDLILDGIREDVLRANVEHVRDQLVACAREIAVDAPAALRGDELARDRIELVTGRAQAIAWQAAAQAAYESRDTFSHMLSRAMQGAVVLAVGAI
jgi:hypothetical protein